MAKKFPDSDSDGNSNLLRERLYFTDSGSEDDSIASSDGLSSREPGPPRVASGLEINMERGYVDCHADLLTGQDTRSLREKIKESRTGLYYFKRGVIPDSLKDFIQNELTRHLDKRFEYEVLESGSQTEGVKLPLFQGSQRKGLNFEYEYDMMLCLKGLKIPFDQADTKLVLQSQIADIPPGYCWVHLDENQKALWNDCSTLVEKDDTSFCFLSPKLIREKLYEAMAHAVQTIGWWEDFKLSLDQQGPAVTLIMTKGMSQACHDCGNELAPKYAPQITFVYNFDVVLAIECGSWPMAAKDWESRDRLWPPKSVVEAIVSRGCHAVPKSSANGNEDLEWRLSFSLAEITLSHQLDGDLPQMKYSWYIIKTLVSKYLISQPKILSSYHVKTLVFWFAERIALHCITKEENYEQFMKKENFVPIVLGLLDEMMYKLVSGTLPNYFVPNCNTITACSPELTLQLCQKIADIRYKLFPYLDFKK